MFFKKTNFLHKFFRRIRLFFKISLWATSTAVFLSLSAGVYLYQKGWIQSWVQNWIENRFIQEQLTKIESKLPFKIEKLEIDAPWSDLIQGKLSKIKATLYRSPLRIHLESPIQILRHGAQFGVEIKPEWLLEYQDKKSNLLNSVVRFNINSQLDISDLQLNSTNQRLDFFGFKIENFELNINQEIENIFTFKLDSKQIEWFENDSQQGNLSFLKTHGKLSLDKDTPPKITSMFQLGLGELLLGDFYADFDLSKTKINFDFDQDLKLNLIESAFKVDAHYGLKNHELNIATHVGNFDRFSHVILPWLQSIKSLSFLKEWTFFSGTLRSQIKAQLKSGFKIKSIATKIRDLSFLWKEKSLLVKNTDIDQNQDSFSLSISEIRYKKLSAQLKSSKFKLNTTDPKFIIPSGHLQIHNLPTQIGEIEISTKPEFQIRSKIKMDAEPLKKSLDLFCIKPSVLDKIPEPKISFNFQDFLITKNSFDANGVIKFDWLGGRVVAEEIGFYDWDTIIPEVDFSIFWENLNLSTLSEHLDFGEIDGTLQGYADNVVFQSWLPTQYAFKFEVKPKNSSKIVFSPDAMKNTIKLFAGEDIEAMPGYAKWLAFGWPSRLLGGYDVEFAGIELNSYDGNIEILTLDSDAVKRNEKRHFIIYGPRFKMPLNSARYPLITDATAMNNFLRHLGEQLKEISNKKKSKIEEIKNDKKNDPCVPTF